MDIVSHLLALNVGQSLTICRRVMEFQYFTHCLLLVGVATTIYSGQMGQSIL
jgi:hypothetical protein